MKKSSRTAKPKPRRLNFPVTTFSTLKRQQITQIFEAAHGFIESFTLAVERAEGVYLKDRADLLEFLLLYMDYHINALSSYRIPLPEEYKVVEQFGPEMDFFVDDTFLKDFLCIMLQVQRQLAGQEPKTFMSFAKWIQISNNRNWAEKVRVSPVEPTEAQEQSAGAANGDGEEREQAADTEKIEFKDDFKTLWIGDEPQRLTPAEATVCRCFEARRDHDNGLTNPQIKDRTGIRNIRSAFRRHRELVDILFVEKIVNQREKHYTPRNHWRIERNKK